MWLPAERLNLTRAERRQLTQLLRDPLTSKKLAQRISILMGASEGKSNSELAQELAVSRPTIIHWRQRYAEAGVEGLFRGGAPAKPKNATGEPRQRRQDTGRPLGIAGVYVGSRDRALVFSAGEGQPEVGPNPPWESGDLPEKQTKDYLRHGTTTLFAALEILLERVGRGVETRLWDATFTEFLEGIEWMTPAGLQVHLIVDSRGTHEALQMKSWFAGHPRFHVHCTPSEGSWLRLAKRWWLVEANPAQMRHRTLGSLAELTRAIDSHLQEREAGGGPFTWTARLFPNGVGAIG